VITREQLEEIGFSSKDNTLYYDAPNYEFEYNVKTQDLYAFDEVDGSTEHLCRVTNIGTLKNVIENYTL
jgi:hypothetical protein